MFQIFLKNRSITFFEIKKVLILAFPRSNCCLYLKFYLSLSKISIQLQTLPFFLVVHLFSDPLFMAIGRGSGSGKQWHWLRYAFTLIPIDFQRFLCPTITENWRTGTGSATQNWRRPRRKVKHCASRLWHSKPVAMRQ